MTFSGSRPTLQRDTWLWDDMPLNSLKRPPYWNSTSGFDVNHITAVDMSFCTSLRNFIHIGPPSAEKIKSCRFSRWRIFVILDFRGPIMGSLKSQRTTSYSSSIDTIAVNWLVFEKIAFLHFGDKIQDGGSSPSWDRGFPPSWILWVRWWVLWKANVRLPIGRQ